MVGRAGGRVSSRRARGLRGGGVGGGATGERERERERIVMQIKDNESIFYRQCNVEHPLRL